MEARGNLDGEKAIKVIAVGSRVPNAPDGPGGPGVSATCLSLLGEEVPAVMLQTIGADFKIKRIVVDGQRVKLQIWDLATEERFKGITQVYYRAADVFLHVVDGSVPFDSKAFDQLQTEIKRVAGDDALIIPVISKKDLAYASEATKAALAKTKAAIAAKYDIPEKDIPEIAARQTGTTPASTSEELQEIMQSIARKALPRLREHKSDSSPARAKDPVQALKDSIDSEVTKILADEAKRLGDTYKLYDYSDENLPTTAELKNAYDRYLAIGNAITALDRALQKITPESLQDDKSKKALLKKLEEPINTYIKDFDKRKGSWAAKLARRVSNVLIALPLFLPALGLAYLKKKATTSAPTSNWTKTGKTLGLTTNTGMWFRVQGKSHQEGKKALKELGKAVLAKPKKK